MAEEAKTPVVELVTKCNGDEEDFFRVRAKVFRFADSEWKERGAGDVLIAKTKEGKKHRILLHREQTLKIAVNFPLIEGVVLKDMGTAKKAVTLAGIDLSDGDQRKTILAVKFTDEENCTNFKTAVEKALKGEELKPEDLVKVEPKVEEPKNEEAKKSDEVAVEGTEDKKDDKKE